MKPRGDNDHYRPNRRRGEKVKSGLDKQSETLTTTPCLLVKVAPCKLTSESND